MDSKLDMQANAGRLKRIAGRSAAAALQIALLAALAAGLLPARAVITEEKPAAEYLKADAPPIAWNVRMGGEISLELPNPKVTYEVGRQLPLFHQTLTQYIAITPSAEGQPELVAFPRYVANEPAAWVSRENLLVFGRRTPSIRGTFTFEANELVPLIRETADTYFVNVERLGHHMTLAVSKKTPGVVLVPIQKPEHLASATSRSAPLRPQTTPEKQPLEAALPPKITPENALQQVTSGTAGPGSTELAAAKMKEDFIKDLMGELDKVKQQRALEEAARKAAAEAAAAAAALITTTSAETTQPATPPEPKVIIQRVEVPVPTPATPTDDTNHTQLDFLITYLQDNAITLFILLICAILLPILAITITRLRARQHTAHHPPPAPAAQPANTSVPLATEVFSFSTVGESHAAAPHHASVAQPAGNTSHGDLSGTLSGHILPQVVQFFCAARESGKMTIRQESGLTEELLFNNGNIIDARTGSISGKDAARAILQQRDGKFTFHRANTSNDRRLIQEDTMALLLEAHQALDEKRRTHHGL